MLEQRPRSYVSQHEVLSLAFFLLARNTFPFFSLVILSLMRICGYVKLYHLHSVFIYIALVSLKAKIPGRQSFPYHLHFAVWNRGSKHVVTD